MNDNQELLLVDSPPGTPVRVYLPPDDEDLLLDGTNDEFSTTENTQSWSEKLDKNNHDTWSSTRDWKQQMNFLWQDESSEEEQLEPIVFPNKHPSTSQPAKTTGRDFPYASLMAKLEQAQQLIEQRQKSKTSLLFSSVRYISSTDEREEKLLKTQKTSKQQETQAQKRNNKVGKTHKGSKMWKSMTEPDQNSVAKVRARPARLKVAKYDTDRVINQVEEQDSPLLKGRRARERQRTKEQFLASMTNWQQQRQIRQQEMIQRDKIESMNGVTFTPEINAKSKQLMKKRGNVLPIYEREMLKAVTPKNAGKGKK